MSFEVTHTMEHLEEEQYWSIPLVTTGVLSAPPIVILFWGQEWVELWVPKLFEIIAIVASILYVLWFKGVIPNDRRTVNEALDGLNWNPNLNFDDEGDFDRYAYMSDKVTTYNSLVVRTSYFSLATQGILASVFFSRVGAIFRPLVSGFGMITAYAFLMIVEKNVNMRDSIRKILKDIEEDSDDKMLLEHLRDDVMDAGKHPNINLANHLVDFSRFWLFVWVVGYHGSIIYLVFINPCIVAT